MDQTRLDLLLEKYMLKTASMAEQQELLDWYQKQNSRDVVWPMESNSEEELVKARLLKNIRTSTKTQTDKPSHVMPIVNRRPVLKNSRIGIWIAVAAVLTGIVLGLVFYNRMSLHTPSQGLVANENDVKPGKNGANITLSNGRVIKLDGSKAGLVIGGGDLKYMDGSTLEQGGAEEVDGQLITAETARGQFYQFMLADGSKVWLNAGSKITFPSRFDAKERSVFLDGEAYFEIQKDQARPFAVYSNGQKVKVLGTHFNINAYQNEDIVKTTLLEGSVRILPGNFTMIPGGSVNAVNVGANEVLKPGQQAELTNSKIVVREVDPDEVVAWKNGEFVFNEESLSSIMRQLARWYDVEVDYSTLPDTRYGGSISRNVNLSKVLRMLELTGNVKLRIEKKVIKVYK